MYLYCFLLITSFILSFVEIITTHRNKEYKLYQKLYILILWGLIAFNRNNKDYNGYVEYFNLGNKLKGYIEGGYLFFSEIIKYFSGSYEWILFITATFFIYVIFGCYRIKYPVAFFFLYLSYNFLYDLPQTRNMLAISLFLYGFNCISMKKRLFYGVLATTFHKIGAIYLLNYLTEKIKLRSYIIGCFTLLIISYFLKNYFLNFGKVIFGDRRTEIYIEYFHGGFKYFIFYFFQIFYDCIIIMLGNLHKKILKQEEKYIKLIIFPISFLIVCFIHTELITRLIRGVFFIKIYYYFNIMFSKHYLNRKLELWILIVIGHFIFYIPNFRADKILFFLNSIEQIDNLLFFYKLN